MVREILWAASHGCVVCVCVILMQRLLFQTHFVLKISSCLPYHSLPHSLHKMRLRRLSLVIDYKVFARSVPSPSIVYIEIALLLQVLIKPVVGTDGPKCRNCRREHTG